MPHNKLTRRMFNRMLLLATAGASLPMTGCDWVKFLADYIPIINDGIGTIETFFGAALPIGISAILDIVKAALADIQTACVDYEKAPAASKATFIEKIEVFLNGLVSGFQQLLDNFGSLGIVPAIVLGVINIVVSTLEWLVGKFSAGVPAYAKTYSNGVVILRTMTTPVRLTVKMSSGSQIITINPIERKQNEFKAEIDSLMAANGRSDIVI